jgi:hypothetical protein
MSDQEQDVMVGERREKRADAQKMHDLSIIAAGLVATRSAAQPEFTAKLAFAIYEELRKLVGP